MRAAVVAVVAVVAWVAWVATEEEGEEAAGAEVKVAEVLEEKVRVVADVGGWVRVAAAWGAVEKEVAGEVGLGQVEAASAGRGWFWASAA